MKVRICGYAKTFIWRKWHAMRFRICRYAKTVIYMEEIACNGI